MKLLVIFPLALALSGCHISAHRHSTGHFTTTQFSANAGKVIPPTNLMFTYRVDGSNAIFDSDKVTLIFPDLPAGQRKAFKGGPFPVQIAGDGITETKVTSRRNLSTSSLTARFENGVTTFNFCGSEVTLRDGASIATTAAQAVDLSCEKKEVFVVSAK